jgi:hypothetical protein
LIIRLASKSRGWRWRERKGKASRKNAEEVDSKRGTDGEYSIQKMEEDGLAMFLLQTG